MRSSAKLCFGFLFSLAPFACFLRGRSLPVPPQQQLTDDQRAARAKLKEGVQAYKESDFDEAIEDFKQAAQLDHSLTDARLYLATAYASQYVPGGLSDENLDYGNQALQEYRSVVDADPKNVSALDGIGQLLYYMSSNPWDRSKLDESKRYRLMHIKIRPDDAEPYFWIGVINWSIAYHAEQQMRAEWKERTAVELPDSESLPDILRQQLKKKTEQLVDEGIVDLKKAIELRPDYDDSMAYLSLIYRRKAVIDADPHVRDEDNEKADEWVNKVQQIKQARMKQQPQP